jgi:hypothetical protein
VFVTIAFVVVGAFVVATVVVVVGGGGGVVVVVVVVVVDFIVVGVFVCLNQGVADDAGFYERALAMQER